MKHILFDPERMHELARTREARRTHMLLFLLLRETWPRVRFKRAGAVCAAAAVSATEEEEGVVLSTSVLLALLLLCLHFWESEVVSTGASVMVYLRLPRIFLWGKESHAACACMYLYAKTCENKCTSI
jgi:hypothetical protein